ncbi:MAG: DUF4313 domain-containing protein [Lachnospiraceae bacterium]|nr:DUF4313 domain-containing protein [Lachnospiraceae bacterium]
MKTFDFEKYGNTYKMKLDIKTYSNGNLALAMCINTEDGWEPWNILTVNLGFPLEKNIAYIDTNNNGKTILAWITRNKLAVSTGKKVRSGFCTYPQYKFREAALREIDPDGYERYLAAHPA